MEAALDPRMLESPNDWAKRMGLVHEKVGTEDVNGETCDKYSYASDAKKMAAGQDKPTMPATRAITGFIWVGQKSHMLLKSENEVTTAEWKNVKVGPPDASVFELPTDYKKLEGGRPFQMKPQAQKPEEQKSEEQKSGGQSPSPAVSASPEASASPEQSPSAQKSDGDK
jgi:hypothetical protein